jgi:hypothetical protein
MKRKKRSFVIVLKLASRLGHTPHRSGSGIHQDRRTKRNRTRATQKEKACQEQ